MTAATTLATILRVDAAACGGMGLLLLAAAPQLAVLLGLPLELLRTVGALLVPFGVFLFWLAPRASRRRAVVRAVVAGNWAWVVASIVLVASPASPRTSIGYAFVVLQAVIVAGFAYLEQREVGRTHAAVGERGATSAVS